MVGILPYIWLRLKAISTSFQILIEYIAVIMPQKASAVPMMQEPAFSVALLLAFFAMMFGTRHRDVAKRTEGMLGAIAFESLVKLVAFTAVDLFVIFWPV